MPDVRPYLQHARVVVAPLRVARGIQNKVLEAMAMARPVVVSTAAAGALSAVPRRGIRGRGRRCRIRRKTIAMMDAERWTAQPGGAAARARILADYGWAANLAPLEALLAHAGRQCGA